MTGMDVQQVLAIRDFLTSQVSLQRRQVELLGTGEGGMTALYSAAVDPDISGVGVINYFDRRENAWEEPVDRMLYGQLNEFGDAEVAALVASRPLDVIYTPAGPTPAPSVASEAARARKFYDALKQAGRFTVTSAPDGDELEQAVNGIVTRSAADGGQRPIRITAQVARRAAEQMGEDHFQELHAYLQRLDRESDAVREKRWQLLSTPVAQRAQRAGEMRKELASLMGVIPDDGTPLAPRSRLIRVTDRYMAYDVLLGVVNGVEAYGQLLVPRNARSRLPAVVCQHGFGGSPINITGVNLFPWETSEVYWEFGRSLADRGYVVFAPYVTTPLAVAEVPVPNLVRLAAMLGMMRTGLEEKKLHKIVDFLQSLSFVDAGRIGYYGLSHGGYDATWMPPLEPRLRFTIISGHFNDWRAKITNEEKPTSYLLHPDLDFHNWDVLDRFTHVELIAAKYPRPVCVEFAEGDGTTTPEWHRRAWDQVQTFARAWGVSDQIVQTHFDGIHEIHGGTTFDFVDRWLRPERASQDTYAYTDLPRRTCKDCRPGLAAELERLEDQDNIPHLYRGETMEFPYLAHQLDASKELLLRGRFRVGMASPVFTGMAFKASRTGYNHHISPKFFENHPESRGYGWGPPLCTSNENVRRYYAEVVKTLFRHAPDVKGLMVIYDSEGFYYCGHSERDLERCPRCRQFSEQQVAAQLLTTLDTAMREQGGPTKESIAWNYNVASQWVLKLFPLLPKDIIIQADFDKGMDVIRDGIRNHTEDFNISSVGPPALCAAEYQAARAAGLTVMAKTEHAVSQEFILVPYIPCLEQWYRRAAKIREFELGGFMANWDHYGYTPSRPALLLNRMAFDPMPSQAQLLRDLAQGDFSSGAVNPVLRAWHDYSEGIRVYPYSDPVARYPCPIQKGPSNPFFLDPAIPDFGRSRSWQNDLKWTAPWGPEITSKYLGQVDDWFAKGKAELADAERQATEEDRAALGAELGIGRTLESSVRSTLNLIDWLGARNQLLAAHSEEARRAALGRLRQVAVGERQNALQILPALEADSRLGYASEGGGVSRGGLFSPELVRWKIGELEDVLLVGLPAEDTTSGSAPGR